MAAAIEARLRAIVSEQLGLDDPEITRVARFRDDLGADSLDAIQLVMATEEAFHLEIDDRVAERFTTFGDLLDYVTVEVAKATGATG